jgi:hypothetical protein
MSDYNKYFSKISLPSKISLSSSFLKLLLQAIARVNQQPLADHEGWMDGWMMRMMMDG